MMKKCTAVLLALLLLIGAAQVASAGSAEEGWLIWCGDVSGETFDVIVVAPARYTRLAPEPRIETTYAGRDGLVVSPASAERIEFSVNGKTETRWALTAACPAVNGKIPYNEYCCAVPAGTLFDGAGNGNARVLFDDATEYMRAGGYVETNVYSALLKRDYDREDDVVAVGDTLRVEYSGLYPVEILVNGETAASFPGGEMQRYTLSIEETGPLAVAVRQNGGEVFSRTLTVITAREMYERNLRDGLITGDDIPGTDDLVDSGLPSGSAFIPLAKIAAFFVLLREFFRRLFSFTRVAP